MENKVVKKDPKSIRGEEYFVSLAPHIRSNDTVRKIMLDVIIALVPALIGSVYFFGLRALIITLVSVISCVASEYVFQRLMKKPIQVHDLSAVVTGILLAFNLPPTMPIWTVVLGSVFSIIVVKECFGGIGFNFMNPALAGRLMMMASWAQNMTDYLSPELIKQGYTSATQLDAISYATPLQLIASGDYANLPALKDMFIGNIGGVLGETSAALLLIGFIYLLIRKVVTIEIPVIYVAVTAIMLKILGIPFEIIPYELLAGGLILGACFMATDYASTPINRRGRVIFAIGCGILTAIIRVKASLPEGVSYAICLMNLSAPLIDKLTRTSAYGEAK